MKDKSKVDDAMADLQNVNADDPDMISKLNEIARRVAKAQGKTKGSNTNTNTNTNIAIDPMDELGCEGCQ